MKFAQIIFILNIFCIALMALDIWHFVQPPTNVDTVHLDLFLLLVNVVAALLNYRSAWVTK